MQVLSDAERSATSRRRPTQMTNSRQRSSRRCAATSRRCVSILSTNLLKLHLRCTRHGQLDPRPHMQLEEMRKNEDPRLSFSTPEFKEAQRIFTDNFKVSAEPHPVRAQCTCNRCALAYARADQLHEIQSRPSCLPTLLCVVPEKLWQTGGVGAGQGPRVVDTAAPQAGQPCACHSADVLHAC